MCHRFFNGVVSEQAEKSARAAYLNSKKGKDNMWSLMSGRMLEGKSYIDTWSFVEIANPNLLFRLPCPARTRAGWRGITCIKRKLGGCDAKSMSFYWSRRYIKAFFFPLNFCFYPIRDFLCVDFGGGGGTKKKEGVAEVLIMNLLIYRTWFHSMA